ncbi:Gldg family protein [Gloeothece verrucosa]|uniref:ABC-type uncharacterized transport system n=1 Tax=Gloeothece verrucosa (strain PCC 7822) TaxID=497965 RepID=E0U9W3_GLOV7|nr:Gldg family protein [Gloeothece verrucosa]ADN15033.1 ABC-type uncharacterized transport system [Gloeothece verrucosa PCC 7822]
MTAKKLLKYLFIPGLILITAGITVRLTITTLLNLATGLMIGGGILLIIWIVWLLISAQGFWAKRSTQVGTNAIISTLSVIAILGIINFLAVRYSTKIDLTENQLFTLSPQSQEIVKNLKEPVKIWLFDNDPSPNDKELLENYRRYSPNFQYEYVNPDQNPGLVRKIGAKALGDVYLQYKDKKQQIQTLITFGTREPLSEIKLTNGIEKILSDRIRTVYFLQGHGEHSLDAAEGGISQAVTSLREKGYQVEPLNLAQSSGIPKDADVIVIAGPKRDLFKQEVEALENYTANGGNLFILLDPTVNAGLTPLLKQWGVALDERIVIDGSGAGESVGLGPATPIITTYGNHPITKDFKNQMSFYPLARAIDTLQTKGVNAVALLVTNNQMWAESDLTADNIAFDKTKDIPGPFDLGVALTRTFSSSSPTKPDANSSSPSESEKQPFPQTTPSPSTTPLEQEKSPTTGVTPSPNSPQKQSTKVTPSPNSPQKELAGVISFPYEIAAQPEAPTQAAKPSPSESSQKKQQTKQNQQQTKETPLPDVQTPQSPSPTSSPPSNFINPDQEIYVSPSASSQSASPSVTPQTNKQEQKPSPSPSVSPSPSAVVSPSPSAGVSPSPSAGVSPSPSAVVSPSPSAVVSPSPSAAVSPSPTNTNRVPSDKPIEAKMVVIGNSSFATNGLFDQQLNGDIFLNSVQWLANGNEQPLSIRPREPQNRRIVLSKLQAGSIFWLSIIVFPLLGFLLAAITWWKKR